MLQPTELRMRLLAALALFSPAALGPLCHQSFAASSPIVPVLFVLSCFDALYLYVRLLLLPLRLETKHP